MGEKGAPHEAIQSVNAKGGENIQKKRATKRGYNRSFGLRGTFKRKGEKIIRKGEGGEKKHQKKRTILG